MAPGRFSSHIVAVIGCGDVGDRESLAMQPRCAGPDDDAQTDPLLRTGPSLSGRPVRRRLACQARAVAGQRHPWRISTASLAVNTIGQGLALARGRMTKHAVKQVDR